MEKLKADMIRNAKPYHPHIDLDNMGVVQLFAWVHPIEREMFKERFENLNDEMS